MWPVHRSGSMRPTAFVVCCCVPTISRRQRSVESGGLYRSHLLTQPVALLCAQKHSRMVRLLEALSDSGFAASHRCRGRPHR